MPHEGVQLAPQQSLLLTRRERRSRHPRFVSPPPGLKHQRTQPQSWRRSRQKTPLQTGPATSFGNAAQGAGDSPERLV